MFKSNYMRYGVVLMIGLVIGYLIFGGNGAMSEDHSEHPHAQGDSTGEIWTCSMHPQIRQNGPGQCPLCGMDLTPVNSGGGSDGDADRFSMTMTPEAVSLAEIRTTEVISGVGEKLIQVPGKVVVPETGLSVVSAQVSGRVIRQMVDFLGKSVSKGDVLLTIWSPELISAQRELIDAVRSSARGMDTAVIDSVAVLGDVTIGSQRLGGDGMDDVFVEAARNKLKFWRLTEDQILQIEQRGRVLNEIEILAPRDGVVMSRGVRPDDVFTPGTMFYEIADLSNVWMEFEVYERDFGLIRKGQRVRYGALSRGDERMIGVVDWIDPVMDNEKRTTRVRVLARNNDGKWSPGMLLNGQIMVDAGRDNMLLVPESAVLWTGPRSVVYVQIDNDGDPKFELREVLIGDRVGDNRIILDGLSQGERIVHHGAFKIDAEFQLRDKASMMGVRE
ncbi:MAG TPA: hypothetical protein DCE78_02895 [Bacteroidetes bacterium]|nr:hypothetical protein [Bacteroidota bacterium]